MVKFFLFILFFSTFTLNCKGKKLNEFKDDSWREESQKIAVEICNKLTTCIEDKESKDRKLQNFIESNLSASRCMDKNKKSNVYKLRGEDPSEIQKNFRTCHQQVLSMNCQEIRSGKINTTPECTWIEKLQMLR